MGAAAVAMLALGGTTVPASAATASVVQQSVNRASYVVPLNDAQPQVRTVDQLVAEGAPERAAVAAKLRAEAAAAARAKAAAKARARAKARAVARAAAARAARTRPASATVASGGSRSVNVWTTGFQTQINECRGGVDLTAFYHTRTVGEHWSCGGSAFPETAGSIVHFSGLDAGTYKVLGVAAVLNAYVAHTSDLPHGYAMLFQTCRNNDSHTTVFIGLERI